MSALTFVPVACELHTNGYGFPFARFADDVLLAPVNVQHEAYAVPAALYEAVEAWKLTWYKLEHAKKHYPRSAALVDAQRKHELASFALALHMPTLLPEVAS